MAKITDKFLKKLDRVQATSKRWNSYATLIRYVIYR